MTDFTGHPRILVLRGGALGDFILTIPAIKALRQRWPNAHIEIIGYPRIAILAKVADIVDEIQSLDRAEMARYFSFKPDISTEQREYMQSFDLVISYLYDPSETVTANLKNAGARQVIYAAPQPKEDHAVVHLMKPLEELAIFAEGNEFPALELDREVLNDYVVPEIVNPDNTMAIHPGSGGKAKNWPVSRFLELADRLSRHDGLSPVLVFGEAESDILSEVEQHNTPHPIFRNLPLLHFAKILTQCRGYLGNDSGATHLAAALGLPSVAVFGPTDPGIWAPAGPNTCVIRSEPPTAEGLQNLSTERVYEQAMHHLDNQTE